MSHQDLMLFYQVVGIFRLLAVPAQAVATWACLRSRGLSRWMWVLSLGFASLFSVSLWNVLVAPLIQVAIQKSATSPGMTPQQYALISGIGTLGAFASWWMIAVGLILVLADIRQLRTIALERGRGPDQTA